MNVNNSLALSSNYENALTKTADYYNAMTMFVKLQMQRDLDYGVIPGTNKPCLFKTGAEKLCRLFNLRPNFNLVYSIVDFDKPLFHYHYRCSLYRGAEMVGEGDGCANSMEIKYQKQKHKVFDLTNTICKIAQKRALIAKDANSEVASLLPSASVLFWLHAAQVNSLLRI